MFNEFIFVAHTVIVTSFTLLMLKFGAQGLTSIMCLQVVLANLVILKQTTLLGLNATCADAFTIGGIICLNLLQEYFGRHEAQKALNISFVLLIFYTLLSLIQVAYIPSPCDTMNQHFVPLFDVMPRIAISSLFTYMLVSKLDLFFYGFLNQFFAGRYLALRNGISIAICQLIDTVLFSFLALYGIIDNLWSIIAISYTIKLLALLVATPLVAFSKRLV